jgi:hypothetical protein
LAKSKAVPDDAKLLESLQAIADGEPRRQLGSGKNLGIFPGTAPLQKALLARAQEEGYLEPCPDPNPPAPKKKGGKAPTPVPHARITPKGLEWVAHQLSPRQALEGLLVVFQKQAQRLENDPPPAPALQEQFDLLQYGLSEIRREIQAAAVERRAREQQLVVTLRTLEPLVKSATSARAPGPTPPSDRTSREKDALEFVRAWRLERGQDCPFPNLYDHLKRTDPALSIGAFQDFLRSLRERDGLRLTGWAGPLDAMPHPELALFVSSKVMFYAHVPDSTA